MGVRRNWLLVSILGGAPACGAATPPDNAVPAPISGVVVDEARSSTPAATESGAPGDREKPPEASTEEVGDEQGPPRERNCNPRSRRGCFPDRAGSHLKR